MNPKEQPDRRRLAVLRLFLFAWMAMIPLASLATSPSWWTTYGVLSGGVANDYSAANQGQARNIAFQAISELNNDLPQFGGAGNALNALAITLSATTAQTQDYSAIALGQMKFLAQPFFDRLMALGYFGPPLFITGTSPIITGTYPWAAPGLGTPNDYAMGNIGQLKYLFSFDVTYSSQGPGDVPNWWASLYFPGQTFNGLPGIDPNLDSNGEGFTMLQNYQNGVNPITNQVVSVGPTVGEYLFHETSGTIAHDISSLHNNGLLSGGAAWSGTGNGYDGQGAITFDGTSGEVLISNTGNQVLPVASAPFSFAFWFNPNAGLSGTTTLMTDEVSSASGFEFGIDSTTSPPSLLFSTGTGGIQFETPFQPGAWTQAAVTYDGTTATIYVNGNVAVSGTGALVSNTNTITLANGPSGTQPFAGAMENLTLYQAVLQPWDVASLYNISTTGTGPDPSGMANWWKHQYFGTLNVDPNAVVPWSVGQMTNLQAFEDGLDPIDFYNGQTPILTIVSGSGQTGSPNPPGNFVPAPLIVSVTDTNGNPLYGAPLTFTVTSGSGVMQVSSTNTGTSTLTLFATSSGQAQVFFQLPATVSSTSQITVTTGTASTAPQVIFSEFSDNGTGMFASPFAPSNIIGSMNGDGSETITWQNNDNSSPIYIYQLLASGTWEVTGTLAAGTTSYTASGSAIGNTEIGNNFSPGGSNPGTTGTGNPANNPYVPIPVQSYAAIDMSGTTTNGNPVSMETLDDSNNAAFASFNGVSDDLDSFGYPAECDVFKWANGSTTALQPMALEDGTSIHVSSPFISPPPSPYPVSVSLYLQPTFLAANGTVFGNALGDNDWAGPVYVGFSAVPSPTGESISMIYPPLPFFSDLVDGAEGEMDAVSSSGSYCAQREIYCFDALSGTSGGVGDPFPANFIQGTSSVAFAPLATITGSIPIIQQAFLPNGVNNNGWAIGYSGSGDALVWTGTAVGLVALAPMEGVTAVNDLGQVVGVTGTTGYLWASGSASCVCPLVQAGVQPISQLIPPQYQKEIANISPIDISGSNATDSSVRILFNALYQTGTSASATPGGNGWSSGAFLLTLTSGTSAITTGTAETIVQQVFIPSNISNFQFNGINASGLIAGIGNITTGTGSAMTTGTSHALLLSPGAV